MDWPRGKREQMGMHRMRIHTFTTLGHRAVAMLLSIILLAVFLVTLGTQPAHAATITESESNETTASADVLPVGTTVTGSTAGANSSRDSDYYAVEVPSDGRLGINFRFPSGLGADTAYNVTVYTSGNKVLYDYEVAGDQNDGSWLSSQATFTPKGRIYVRVYGYSSRPSWGKAYQLTVKATPGTVETEFNDSTSAADSLALGKTITGSTLLGSSSRDSDYYAVEVPANGRLGVNLKFPAGLGANSAYNVTVYNSAGKVLYDYEVVGDQNDGTWLNAQATFTPKGRIYVRVYGYSSRPSWGKAYQLTVTSTPGNVETEFNDSTSTADPLALGKTITGSTLLGSSSSDSDYYAISIPADGRLGVNLRFPSGLGADTAYNLAVYTSAGKLLYDYEIAGDQNDGTWLNSQATFTPKGLVYVRVHGYSSRPSWGKAYQLTVKASPGTVETEFNDSTSTADALALGTTITGSTLLGSSSSDSDYYVVDVAAATGLVINFKFPTGLGSETAYDVKVYNSAGKALYDYTLSGNVAGAANGSWLRGQAITVPKGRVYLRVLGYSSRPSWGQAYTLSATYAWAASPLPKISGTAKVGKTLTAKVGTWSPKPSTLTYQWLRNGKAITGATKPTYTASAADAGTKLTVATTGKRTGYNTVTRTSASLAIPKQIMATTPTPKISGTAQVGKVLTAKPGTWSPSSVVVRYQWLRNGQAISGATKATYKATSRDAGAKLSLKTTGTKTGYTSVSKTSSTVTVKK